LERWVYVGVQGGAEDCESGATAIDVEANIDSRSCGCEAEEGTDACCKDGTIEER
jgi:hypothetical protein